MKKKFEMNLALISAIENYVSSYCLIQVKKKFPASVLGNYPNHEDCEAYFETLFENVMDNMKITLTAPDWPSIQIPLNRDVELKLESTYEA